jgi:hypothetical protein
MPLLFSPNLQTGDILTFTEGGDFRGVVANPCEGAIESIAGFAKGFVCGLGDGVLQMYEKDEKDGFKRRAPQQIKNNAAKVQRGAHHYTKNDEVKSVLLVENAFRFGLKF